MPYHEVNFDGLVGPTHNYAGLAFGNLASRRNRSAVSNPRAAALQGLEKMRMLMELGVPQAVLPPQIRPDIATLYRLGFHGTEQQILEKAWKQAPDLFSACCSASSMWSANAATVAPSCDTENHKLIFTPANLLFNFHRSLEAVHTTAMLRAIFNNDDRCQVNDPLPAYAGFADEGAANHMRLSGGEGEPGLHVFVYGTEDHLQQREHQRFPARQTLAASQAVARLNRLPEDRTLFVQQNPHAIDAGVFHNDVAAVSHDQILFCHERAFVDQSRLLQTLRNRMGGMLQIVQVKEDEVPLETAVNTYLFNGQIVSLSNGSHCLVLPVECEENTQVDNYVKALLRDQNVIDHYRYVDVRQSMRNGGGPACLRLRVMMSDDELMALEGRALLTPERYQALKDHVSATYPDQLRLEDLQDWTLCRQLQEAVAGIRDLLAIVI